MRKKKVTIYPDIPVNGVSKKCKKCAHYYTDKNDQCFYHTGVFKKIASHPYFVGGGAGYWSCCDKNEEDQKGCQTGLHIEDKNTTKALNLFSQLNPPTPPQEDKTTNPLKSLKEEEPLLNIENVNNIQLNKLYPELWNDDNVVKVTTHEELDPLGRSIELDMEQQQLFMQSKQQLSLDYYKHLVRFTDTLPGLSFKYGVTITEIKQLNNIQNNNDLYSFAEIKIPKNEDIKIDFNETEEELLLKRKMLIQSMRKKYGVTFEVAKYYLELYDFDYDYATKDYVEDFEWEKSHPIELVSFSEQHVASRSYSTSSKSSKNSSKKKSKGSDKNNKKKRALSSSCPSIKTKSKEKKRRSKRNINKL